ncbi:phd zinc finger-containing protein [Stylonychia lemnae]|uniref:Phd zinc finger-containing protein n=1 Tax=Stylonychia lemnae TaxID=5949 RepID=A0A078B6L3_STYLE|nr:phd zinc finger-containing protein [Stylonychia lemnae]|eukprot:CDW90175.1 phd zinc finger-containing protein [Stylonychia lemnae]
MQNFVQQQDQIPSNTQCQILPNYGNAQVLSQSDDFVERQDYSQKGESIQDFAVLSQQVHQQAVQIDTEMQDATSTITKQSGISSIRRVKSKSRLRNNLWENKSIKRSRQMKKRQREKQKQQQSCEIPQQNRASETNSLIDKICSLNINEVSSRLNRPPKQPRQKKPRAQCPSAERISLDRKPRMEKPLYNLTQLSQNSVRLNRFSTSQATVINQDYEPMEIEVADSFDPNKPYDKIYITQNEVDEDIQCDVCLEYDFEDDDQIILCELCNAACHQSCYGSELLNGLTTESWYCQRCRELREKPEMRCTEIKCFLCPDVDGLMKKVDHEKWAHLICVNWNQDIYYTDQLKEAISGEVMPQRYHLACNKCKVSNIGACIQCDFKNCPRSYHVRCAVRRGLIHEWSEYEERYGDQLDQHFVPMFCCNHQDQGSKIFKQQGQQGLISKQFTKEFREKMAQLNIAKKSKSCKSKSALNKKKVIKSKQALVKKESNLKLRTKLGKLRETELKRLRANMRVNLKAKSKSQRKSKILAKRAQTKKIIKKTKQISSSNKQKLSKIAQKKSQKIQGPVGKQKQQQKQQKRNGRSLARSQSKSKVKPTKNQNQKRKSSQQNTRESMVDQARNMVPPQLQSQFDQFINMVQTNMPMLLNQNGLNPFQAALPLLNMNTMNAERRNISGKRLGQQNEKDMFNSFLKINSKTNDNNSSRINGKYRSKSKGKKIVEATQKQQNLGQVGSTLGFNAFGMPNIQLGQSPFMNTGLLGSDFQIKKLN